MAAQRAQAAGADAADRGAKRGADVGLLVSAGRLAGPGDVLPGPAVSRELVGGWFGRRSGGLAR